MLPGEQSLPRSILTAHPLVVNQLFDYLKQDCDRLFFDRFYKYLKQLQVHWLNQQRHLILCPNCRGRQLIRKGWRKRILNTTRGRITVVVQQVRCKCCGRTFRPLNERIGLARTQRFSDELIDKALRLAVQIPYTRSASVIRLLTEGSISAEGLRQQMARKAALLRWPSPTAKDTVLVDSTKVKSGTKQRGRSVYMAIKAKPQAQVAGRPRIAKRILHLHVGDSQPLKNWLSRASIKRLVHDGGEHLVDYSVFTQRCQWHLVYQLKHYLWQDGVAFEDRAEYQKQLKQILYDPSQGQSRMKRFIKQLDRKNLKTSSGHLKAAEPEAFMNIKEPGFMFCTTTPIEREIRELNRRADVGARWSDLGIENVLKVLFDYRLNSNGEPYYGEFQVT